MYFLQVGEPYIIRASDGSKVGFMSQALNEALEAGKIKGYWFVEEQGIPKAILYVTEEGKEDFSTDPAISVITNEKAVESILSFYPLSLLIGEISAEELQLSILSPYLEETTIVDSAGREIGRGQKEIRVKKPAPGQQESWTAKLWGKEASNSFEAPVLPEIVLPSPRLTVSQSDSDFILSVSNLFDRTYDLYVCDAEVTSVVDFTAANLIASNLSEPFVDSLSPGQKRIARARVEEFETNQVYYELGE